jgi:hypothetical protein
MVISEGVEFGSGDNNLPVFGYRVNNWVICWRG